MSFHFQIHQKGLKKGTEELLKGKSIADAAYSAGTETASRLAGADHAMKAANAAHNTLQRNDFVDIEPAAGGR